MRDTKPAIELLDAALSGAKGGFGADSRCLAPAAECPGSAFADRSVARPCSLSVSAAIADAIVSVSIRHDCLSHGTVVTNEINRAVAKLVLRPAIPKCG